MSWHPNPGNHPKQQVVNSCQYEVKTQWQNLIYFSGHLPFPFLHLGMVPALCKRKFGHPQIDTLWNSACQTIFGNRICQSCLWFLNLQGMFWRDLLSLYWWQILTGVVFPSNFSFLVWLLDRDHLQVQFWRLAVYRLFLPPSCTPSFPVIFMISPKLPFCIFPLPLDILKLLLLLSPCSNLAVHFLLNPECAIY